MTSIIGFVFLALVAGIIYAIAVVVTQTGRNHKSSQPSTSTERNRPAGTSGETTVFSRLTDS